MIYLTFADHQINALVLKIFLCISHEGTLEYQWHFLFAELETQHGKELSEAN